MICVETRRKRDRESKRARGLTAEQREHKREYMKKWHRNLPEEQRKRLRDRTKKYASSWFAGLTEEDRRRIRERAKERRKAKMQIEDERNRINERIRLNRAKNPLGRLKAALRCRLYSAIRGGGFKKSKSLKEWLGCDYETLKTHIESKFWPGMSWENYGKWQVDHIKPIASAETIEDVYRLNHYTNLQPLWKLDNIRKGAKHIDLCPMSASIVMLTVTG